MRTQNGLNINQTPAPDIKFGTAFEALGMMMTRRLCSLIFLFFNLVALQGWADNTSQPLTLGELPLEDAILENLDQAITEYAPSLILVVDNKTLIVSAFVNGTPERRYLKDYWLVENYRSTNGKPKYKTPTGIFFLNSERMKEHDWSTQYNTQLLFTLFWKNYFTKKFNGIGFHAAPASREADLGIRCATHGCVNLSTEDSQRLFLEITNFFSGPSKGGDVLILSQDYANNLIYKNPSLFLKPNFSQRFYQRWNDLYAHHQSKVTQETPPLLPSTLEEKQQDLKTNDALWTTERILLDTRRPIAGNGDTASSLFLIQNILKVNPRQKIDLLVDDRSERILKNLSLRLIDFTNNVRLLHTHELEAKYYTLVIRTGQPSGRILVDDLNFVSGKTAPTLPGTINVTNHTVLMTWTIYGNSQNLNSVQPYSVASINQSFVLLPSSGLDIQKSETQQIDPTRGALQIPSFEGGIFRDPFSLSIRTKTVEELESFILDHQADSDLKNLFSRVFQLRKTQGTKYALAYGFSIPQVRGQARDYFRGLLGSPTPTIIITPSAFSDNLLSSFSLSEQERIQIVSMKDLNTWREVPPSKSLVILQIPNIPHILFASLLLASQRNRVVPLGAGDGFFSTALSLGVPFVPTLVDWNIRNVRALARILQLEGLKEGLNFYELQNLRFLYSPIPNDPLVLGRSQQLLRYESLFKNLIFEIPDLFGTIQTTVSELRRENSNLRKATLSPTTELPVTVRSDESSCRKALP